MIYFGSDSSRDEVSATIGPRHESRPGETAGTGPGEFLGRLMVGRW
jgi:hypothetical protein